jgi:hypothetical protein
MIDHIMHNHMLLAIIIRSTMHEKGIHFCTPHDFSQQLAYMHHPKGVVIQAHVHNAVRRSVFYTQEVLFIRRGVLRVDLYSEEQQYLESRMLQAGDVILLAAGGHGFEVIEEVEIIEVKQGPYAGVADKTRFDGVGPEVLCIKKVDAQAGTNR